MHILGIFAGLASAVLQSCAYVSSAVFLKRHRGNAKDMLAFTQLVQALWSVPILIAVAPAESLLDGAILRSNLYWLAIFTVTQFAMFYAQRTVEPSKIATWLGLKIGVLAILTSIWPLNGEVVRSLQWAAILVTISAAWLLNGSGGLRPGKRGAMALAFFIVVASLCDREQVFIMTAFQRSYGIGMFQSALATLSLGYVSFGAIAATYIGVKIARGESVRLAAMKLRDSSPFAFFWFTAMISIYFCYGELGPVFGNVVQSTRAVISVSVGYLAFRFLRLGVELPVSPALWLRRLAAAALMTLGIVAYSLLAR